MLFAFALVGFLSILSVLWLFFKREGADMKRSVPGFCRKSFFVAFLIFFSSGCSPQDQPVLHEKDRKFAAFYADYLTLSGIAGDAKESDSLIGGKNLDSLFDVHALSLESFNERTDVYKENPKLWRAVLQEVKDKLQKNDG